MSNATKYEVIHKSTLEVLPTEKYESNDVGGITVHLLDGTPVIFDHNNVDGNLQNPMYVIREVDTHGQADGTGTVEIVPEGVVEIDGGVPELQVAPEVVVEAPVVGNDVPMTQPNDAAPAEVAPVADVTAPAPESNI